MTAATGRGCRLSAAGPSAAPPSAGAAAPGFSSAGCTPGASVVSSAGSASGWAGCCFGGEAICTDLHGVLDVVCAGFDNPGIGLRSGGRVARVYVEGVT